MSTIFDIGNEPVEITSESNVYVIGPISKYEHAEGNKWNINGFNNVRDAIANMYGASVTIPQDFIPDDIPYEDMMDMSFDHLRQQDIIVRLHDWTDSSGAKRETEFAISCGIPIVDENEIMR